MNNLRKEIRFLLKKHWGHDDFRELQEEIILSVLEGHDTLGLLPTGGGKSITFQIPALYLGGLTLVITPLVSLMKDQVDNLKKIGLGAVFIHSAMTYPEVKHAWDKIINASNCHFLYVSPERLKSDHFCQQLRTIGKVKLVVIDEAHCISQWGHDFRPSYRNIARLRKFLQEGTRFMALTASATPNVVDDICTSLQFIKPKIFRKSFSRNNITYVVRKTDDKDGMLLKILNAVPESSIIYVRSRKLTLEIASRLQSEGIKAEPFHAGMSFEIKEERQRKWKKGDIRVMVATNAFGMGIDKPDVRSVIHYSMPGSLEEYYQEAGRAGRDGLLSYAVALTGGLDNSLLRRRVSESFPSKEKIAEVYEMVCNFLNISLEEGANRIYAFDIKEFCRIFHFQERQVVTCLGILSGAGYLEYIEDTDSSTRIMFVCDREELYHFNEHEFPGAERVVEIMLRNYPGLFSDYIPVSESKLAYETGFQLQKIHEILLYLSRSRLISYIPKRNVPCIFMSQDRIEPHYLLIPKAVYEDRKNSMMARIDSVINYCSDEDNCRQIRLLKYFGETSYHPCGHCDKCRETANKKKKQSSDKEIIGNIIDLLRKFPNGLASNVFLSSFSSEKRRVVELLSQLEDEGIISRNNNNFLSLT